MKRSEINQAITAARHFFEQKSWILPANCKWDVTDFGLNDFNKFGLVLITLSDEPEYCEKLMYAGKGQTTPNHFHKKKKEDIICRSGVLVVQVWPAEKQTDNTGTMQLKLNGEMQTFKYGEKVSLRAGDRITLPPYVGHEFYPETPDCIIGEVSTHNDDLTDNFFENKAIGRFCDILEDEPAMARLVNE